MYNYVTLKCIRQSIDRWELQLKQQSLIRDLVTIKCYQAIQVA
jgi:hypothetical protein